MGGLRADSRETAQTTAQYFWSRRMNPGFRPDRCPCGYPWEECPNNPFACAKPQALDSVVDSVVIRRLIEEVRLERESPSPHAYNRIYNRHNR
jgi:hypothetical protein